MTFLAIGSPIRVVKLPSSVRLSSSFATPDTVERQNPEEDAGTLRQSILDKIYGKNSQVSSFMDKLKLTRHISTGSLECLLIKVKNIPFVSKIRITLCYKEFE